jgi:hypothetical protein
MPLQMVNDACLINIHDFLFIYPTFISSSFKFEHCTIQNIDT